MKRFIFAAAAIAAMFASSIGAANADWSSTLAGDYTWASWGKGEDVVGLHGATMTGLFDSISIQANGDYRYRFGSGSQISTGDLDGTLIWNAADDWRIAATGGAKLFRNETIWHYGGGAQWFIAPDLEIEAKGLMVEPRSLTGTHRAGDYGGQLSYYWNPDLQFSASGMHDIFDSMTDYSFHAEYQAWNGISFYAGYTYEPLPTHSFFVGLKIYCDGPAPSTLVDLHRTGPLPFIPGYTNLDFDT